MKVGSKRYPTFTLNFTYSTESTINKYSDLKL